LKNNGSQLQVIIIYGFQVPFAVCEHFLREWKQIYSE